MLRSRDGELDDLRDEVRAGVPPATILAALAAGGKPTNVVLGAAMLLVQDIAPQLLAAVERAASAETLSEAEDSLAFYGLHILGAARDTRGFPALLKMLRHPTAWLDRHLGDALTQSGARIGIGMFDGDAAALFDLIADPAVDQFARAEMFGVAIYAAFEGRIDREEFKRFLLRFDDERLPPPQDFAWFSWECAVSLLAFHDLVPRVEAMWRDGRTPPRVSEPKYFFRDLKRAEKAWNDRKRFDDFHRLGYIEDIAVELEWVAEHHEDATPDDANGFPRQGNQSWNVAEPYVNPMRHVGRNDPCPCGSGKKAKRCCLAG